MKTIMKNTRLNLSFAMLLSLFLGAANVQAAEVANQTPVTAGKLLLVTGTATATDRAGNTRRLRKGESVFSGDTIKTQRHTYANIEFTDGGRTLLRPNTEFEIESYAYTPPAKAKGGPRSNNRVNVQQEGNVALRLVRGGFRALTGLIGKRNRAAYKVKTPVATIGIRGTDFVAVVCEEGDCEGAKPGDAVIGVMDGGVTVTHNNNGQSQDVDPGQFLMATALGVMKMMDKAPEFMMMTPMQNPADCD